MSFRDKEREFQLELLRTQIEHRRIVAFYSAGITVGTSFILFALTFGLAMVLSEKKVPSLWSIMFWAYLIVGSIFALSFILLLARLKLSERKDIERIRKKYLDW